MARTIVVGAGFAGIATAYHLTRLGGAEVVLLEREQAPGQHASGRNAGIIQTMMRDPDLQALALKSAKAFLDLPADLRNGPEFFKNTGSLMLGTGSDIAVLERSAAVVRDHGADVTVANRAPASAGPWLEGAQFEACFTNSLDGVADVHALLHAYLSAARARGAILRSGVEVQRLLTRGSVVQGVETDQGVVEGDVVVNAAGAWAGTVGESGVADRLGIESRRRHLFTTGPVPGVDPDGPVIWNDASGYYFRPESGGFLVSGMDQTVQPAGDPVVDPSEEERLAEKLSACVPALAELSIAKRWACLRTFSADDRMVVGWDPKLSGLYWVAALGGAGVTVSYAVGALAAGEISAGAAAMQQNPFSPSRFAG